ncbi:hypothetical protein LINGRAHAP2_LOCUS24581 [Linum grandiflorum]
MHRWHIPHHKGSQFFNNVSGFVESLATRSRCGDQRARGPSISLSVQPHHRCAPYHRRWSMEF